MAAKFPAYNGNGKFVFVSYAHKDSDKVYPIISALNEMGYNIWYDEGIPLVVDYAETLYYRIRDCAAVLLFVSEWSVKSKDVDKEIRNALSFDKKVVRVNIDDSSLPAAWGYHLPSSTQYISINAEPSEFYGKLCQAIAECRDPQKPADRKPQETPAPAPAPEDDYVERFPMENLPPMVEAPESSTDKYSDSDFISDLRYLGNFEDYAKRRASRVKVKVAPTPTPKKAEKRAGIGKNGKIIAAVLAVVLIIGAVAGGIAIANRKPTDGPTMDERQEAIESMADDLREQEDSRALDEIYDFAPVEGGYEIKDYKGDAKELTLPSEYNGEPVVAIDGWAFYDCTSLTSITIPDSVTSIGSYVFSGCTSLTSITIPDGVKSIGVEAFSGCTNLTSITIPDSVTSIGSSAFLNCSNLTSITIPDSVTSIGYSAFAGCESLTSITIPDSVERIGSNAFSDCTSLTSITIPDSVTSIGGFAFYGCTSLTSITIPDSVTSIGGFAFYGCIITVRAPHVPSYYGYYPNGGVTWVIE